MASLPLRPSLPAPGAAANHRADGLKKARETYAWDWSWPPGCATLRRLPKEDRYGLDFIAETAALQLRVRANRTALVVEGAELGGWTPASVEHALLHPTDVTEEIARGAPTTHPDSIEDYAKYFALLPSPPLATRLSAHPEDADSLFAWQRVAGANPMALRRASRRPEELDAPPALDAALARAHDLGRLFEVDFSLLHGVTTNRYLDRQKYLCGARGWFSSEGGPLRPMAVQLEPGGRAFTPADGVAWTMAKYCLQVTDANVHETMEHLGATHMVMEAIGIAARRQLAPSHPVRLLLEHHLVGTFAINESAKTSLVAPEGVIDRVFGARIDLAAGLVRVALDRFSLQDCAPAQALRARGVDDREVLPEFPYRDDVLRVYGAIERFVERYVRIYYADDAAVSADIELRAWVAEVGSPIGGNLRGVRPVETIAELVTWTANAVHIASAQHAAVNFPQYDCFGWGANAAGACWAPPPRGEATEAELLAMMPAWDCLMLQTDSVYQLAGVYYGRLGEYRFVDPRAVAEVARFIDELRTVERAIEGDDQGRRLSYPYLLPSKIPPSINI